ncbi:MAG: hypothetical protein AAB195_07715, partial [candidate division NC10 bacterium]
FAERAATSCQFSIASLPGTLQVAYEPGYNSASRPMRVHMRAAWSWLAPLAPGLARLRRSRNRVAGRRSAWRALAETGVP